MSGRRAKRAASRPEDALPTAAVPSPTPSSPPAPPAVPQPPPVPVPVPVPIPSVPGVTQPPPNDQPPPPPPSDTPPPAAAATDTAPPAATPRAAASSNAPAAAATPSGTSASPPSPPATRASPRPAHARPTPAPRPIPPPTPRAAAHTRRHRPPRGVAVAVQRQHRDDVAAAAQALGALPVDEPTRRARRGGVGEVADLAPVGQQRDPRHARGVGRAHADRQVLGEAMAAARQADRDARRGEVAAAAAEAVASAHVAHEDVPRRLRGAVGAQQPEPLVGPVAVAVAQPEHVGVRHVAREAQAVEGLRRVGGLVGLADPARLLPGEAAAVAHRARRRPAQLGH